MPPKRRYEQKERARRQAQTRWRIVDAAVSVHEEVGPVRATVAEIARRAGVQRLTVYNHFPEDADLVAATLARVLANHPPPDPLPWVEEVDPARRTRRAIREVHAWYLVGERALTHFERDAAGDTAMRAAIEAARRPWEQAARAVLSAGLPASARVRAAIGLALSFAAWQRLVRFEGLAADEAVEVLAGAVAAAAPR